jgi:hypothetical protein
MNAPCSACQRDNLLYYTVPSFGMLIVLVTLHSKIAFYLFTVPVIFACMWNCDHPCDWYLQEAPWLAEATALRFKYDECIETRTWEDIAQEMQKSDFVTTGILASQFWKRYEAWVCWQQHECLSRVPHSPRDSMCYVHDEQSRKWLAWGLKSEVFLCVK